MNYERKKKESFLWKTVYYEQQVKHTEADNDEKQKMFRQNNNLLHWIFRRHIRVILCPTHVHIPTFTDTGFPLFYWQKIQDLSETFQNPMTNFPRPFSSPRMFKYTEKK